MHLSRHALQHTHTRTYTHTHRKSVHMGGSTLSAQRVCVSVCECLCVYVCVSPESHTRVFTHTSTHTLSHAHTQGERGVGFTVGTWRCTSAWQAAPLMLSGPPKSLQRSRPVSILAALAQFRCAGLRTRCAARMRLQLSVRPRHLQ